MWGANPHPHHNKMNISRGEYMLQTKKLSPKSDKVAVSFDPLTIYIRESGRAFIGNELTLVHVDENAIHISKDAAERFGLAIEIESEKDEQDKYDLLDKCEDRICAVCGKPVNAGYTNSDYDFFVHEECFETYMNESYGYWFRVEDDGCGGYYMGCEKDEPIGPYATGIFYTEWEE